MDNKLTSKKIMELAGEIWKGAKKKGDPFFVRCNVQIIEKKTILDLQIRGLEDTHLIEKINLTEPRKAEPKKEKSKDKAAA